MALQVLRYNDERAQMVVTLSNCKVEDEVNEKD